MNTKLNDKHDEHRIWIEIENTSDPVIGEKRAKMANELLRRMGVRTSTGCGFEWWSDRHYSKSAGYIFDYGGGGGFEELGDNGKWLNLDWLFNQTPEPKQEGEADEAA